MSLLNRITTGIKEVGQTVIEPVSNVGQSVYGAGKEAYSDRFPNPKSIGGPVTNISTGVSQIGMDVGSRLKSSVGGFSKFKESVARTIVGGLDPVFGKDGVIDISDQAKAGDYGGALTQITSQTVDTTADVVDKVGDVAQSTAQNLTLPLLAVAGILLLK
tara:strand:- start:1246 stop:1725 length:480 start_codon:yes stop_codon:yes gene_type:complete